MEQYIILDVSLYLATKQSRKGVDGLEENRSPAQVVLLIPALDPDRRLLELLERLKDSWAGPVVLVDDGSDQDHKDIFTQALGYGCDIVVHAKNLGKGRGLKTGFNYILTHYPAALGCITADADGQHTVEDINACARALIDAPTSLILGYRDFDTAGIPFRSRAGNRITRSVMRFLCGVGVTDTQTGLRGIPRDFMLHMLDVPGERFEYETNMLLETRTQEVPIREVPIQTLYLEENKSSHFNPLLDSFRIYALLLKFCAASVAGFVVDILFFSLFYYILFPSFFPRLVDRFLSPAAAASALVFVCTVLARVISASVNYLLNRKAVFKSKKSAARSGLRYLILCVVQVLLSAALVALIRHLAFPGPLTVWKILVDLILFLLSFQIQRRWVF